MNAYLLSIFYFNHVFIVCATNLAEISHIFINTTYRFLIKIKEQ